jgi:hypothetical protein
LSEDGELTTKSLLVVGLLCCSAFGQAGKPDFSGSWKLNNARSAPRDDARPENFIVVAQTPNSITTTTKAAGITNIFDGTLPIEKAADAKHRITHLTDKYRYTKVWWENNTLMFEILDKNGKKDESRILMAIRESWNVSPDGKVLTTFRQYITAAMNGHPEDRKYVYDKQ